MNGMAIETQVVNGVLRTDYVRGTARIIIRFVGDETGTIVHY